MEPEVHIFWSKRCISFVARGPYLFEPEVNIFEARGAYLLEPEVHIFLSPKCISFEARGAYLLWPEVHIF